MSLRQVSRVCEAGIPHFWRLEPADRLRFELSRLLD